MKIKRAWVSHNVFAPTEWCTPDLKDKLQEKLKTDVENKIYPDHGILRRIIHIDREIPPGSIVDISGRIRFSLRFYAEFITFAVGDRIDDISTETVNSVGTFFQPDPVLKIFVPCTLDVGKKYNLRISDLKYENNGIYAIGELVS